MDDMVVLPRSSKFEINSSCLDEGRNVRSWVVLC